MVRVVEDIQVSDRVTVVDHEVGRRALGEPGQAEERARRPARGTQRGLRRQAAGGEVTYLGSDPAMRAGVGPRSAAPAGRSRAGTTPARASAVRGSGPSAQPMACTWGQRGAQRGHLRQQLVVQPQAVLEAVHPGLYRPAARVGVQGVDRDPPTGLVTRWTVRASTSGGSNRGAA